MRVMRRMRNAAGFSLIEVLVALAVAAVLSLALIGAQQRAFEMAQAGSDRWRTLDLAMAILVENPPAHFATPTGGWAQRTTPPEGEWMIARETVPLAGSWQTLSTRSGKGFLTFAWPDASFTPLRR